VGAGESHRRLVNPGEGGVDEETMAFDGGAQVGLLVSDGEVDMALVAGRAQLRTPIDRDTEFRFGVVGQGSTDGTVVAGSLQAGGKFWLSEKVALNFDGVFGYWHYGEFDGNSHSTADDIADEDNSTVGAGLALGVLWVAVVERMVEPYFSLRLGAWTPVFGLSLDGSMGMNVYLSEQVSLGLELGILEYVMLGWLPTLPAFHGGLGVGVRF